jgi:hypothetical protein
MVVLCQSFPTPHFMPQQCLVDTMFLLEMLSFPNLSGSLVDGQLERRIIHQSLSGKSLQ